MKAWRSASTWGARCKGIHSKPTTSRSTSTPPHRSPRAAPCARRHLGTPSLRPATADEAVLSRRNKDILCYGQATGASRNRDFRSSLVLEVKDEWAIEQPRHVSGIHPSGSTSQIVPWLSGQIAGMGTLGWSKHNAKRRISGIVLQGPTHSSSLVSSRGLRAR